MEKVVQDAIAKHRKCLEQIEADSRVIESIATLFITRLKRRGKIIFMGNGGSAADAQHLAAELVVRFKKNRDPISALALTTDTSVLTAAANDFAFEDIFQRQIQALANTDDVVVAISTSGNSQNLIKAITKAKELGAITVGFLGKDGGKLKSIVDAALLVQSNDTACIQEMHILAGHIICEIVEIAMAGSVINNQADDLVSNKTKLRDVGSLKRIVEEAKTRGRVVGFTNGCFDLIHPGHIKILREAKDKGDILIVGLNSDISVKKIKGENRPVLDEVSRQQVLEAISFVDYIVLFDEDTPHNLIKELRPHYLVKGQDWKEEEIAGREFVDRIYRVELQQGHSTSQMIEKIAQ